MKNGLVLGELLNFLDPAEDDLGHLFSGWETANPWEAPSISTTSRAPACSAMKRCTATGMFLSSSSATNQDGIDFHAAVFSEVRSQDPAQLQSYAERYSYVQGKEFRAPPYIRNQ
jgi:hypothetical protein